MARIILLLLLAASVAALRSRGGSVEWLLTAVFGMVAAGCLVIPYISVGKIAAVRTIEGADSLADGDSLNVKLTVRMSRPAPLMWMAIHEELVHVDGDGGTTGTSRVTCRALGLSGFGRSRTIGYTVRGLRRGEWWFGPATVAVGDLFGLTVRKFRIDAGGQALVRPDAPAGESAGTMPGAGGKGGAGAQPNVWSGASMLPPPASRLRSGAGPLSRPYIPGDPLWRIDWRAMGRGLGMRTRIGEDEMPGEAVLVLDLSRAAYGDDGRLLDASAGRAAAALRSFVADGCGVTLLCAGSRLLRCRIGPGDAAALRGAERMMALLQADGKDSLASSLAQAAASSRSGASIICFSTADAQLLPTTVHAPGGQPDRSSTKGGAVAAGGINGLDTDTVALSALTKLARERGAGLHLLLSCPGPRVSPSERACEQRLASAGYRVLLLPVPDDYRRRPAVAEGGGSVGQIGGQ